MVQRRGFGLDDSFNSGGFQTLAEQLGAGGCARGIWVSGGGGFSKFRKNIEWGGGGGSRVPKIPHTNFFFFFFWGSQPPPPPAPPRPPPRVHPNIISSP